MQAAQVGLFWGASTILAAPPPGAQPRAVRAVEQRRELLLPARTAGKLLGGSWPDPEGLEHSWGNRSRPQAVFSAGFPSRGVLAVHGRCGTTSCPHPGASGCSASGERITELQSSEETQEPPALSHHPTGEFSPAASHFPTPSLVGHQLVTGWSLVGFNDSPRAQVSVLLPCTGLELLRVALPVPAARFKALNSSSSPGPALRSPRSPP